jgi:hypothetical protein
MVTPTVIDRRGEEQPGKPFFGISPWDGYWTQRLPFTPGDRLWVREAWRTEKRYDALKPVEIPKTARIWWELDRDNCDQHGRYRYARFMPRRYSRLTLLVTDVRVQRLQDIEGDHPDESDAIAEGVRKIHHGDGDYYYSGFRDEPHPKNWRDPANAFRELWNSINGPAAWDANPWVVAVTFEVVQAGRAGA